MQTLGPHTFRTQLNLRGNSQQQAFVQAAADVGGLALPLQVNSAAFNWEHGVQILCLGPNEWLLQSEQEQADWEMDLSRNLTGVDHSLVDLSHGLMCFMVQGTGADEWLQRGCPLDLHPQVFPRGSLAQSHIAKTNVSIVCVQAGQAYQVHVRSSFVGYLQAWLEAARDGV